LLCIRRHKCACRKNEKDSAWRQQQGG
jgi:hypothetical protein